MKERLFEIIKRNELTAWRFAELLEVQPSSISHILSGRNKPSFDFIEKILTKFPDINPDWLILGQGDMIRDGYNDEPEQQDVDEDPDAAMFDLTPDESVESIVTDVNLSDIDDVMNSVNTDITNVIHSKQSILTEIKEEFPPILPIFAKEEVERVMIFYTNGTFTTYTPK